MSGSARLAFGSEFEASRGQESELSAQTTEMPSIDSDLASLIEVVLPRISGPGSRPVAVPCFIPNHPHPTPQAVVRKLKVLCCFVFGLYIHTDSISATS